LPNCIVDLNPIAQRPDIEAENRTGVMALGRLAHLLQAYIRLDVLRTACKIDFNLGRRGNRAREIMIARAPRPLLATRR
jgi:hypothetical protein